MLKSDNSEFEKLLEGKEPENVSADALREKRANAVRARELQNQQDNERERVWTEQQRQEREHRAAREFKADIRRQFSEHIQGLVSALEKAASLGQTSVDINVWESYSPSDLGSPVPRNAWEKAHPWRGLTDPFVDVYSKYLAKFEEEQRAAIVRRVGEALVGMPEYEAFLKFCLSMGYAVHYNFRNDPMRSRDPDLRHKVHFRVRVTISVSI